MILGIDPKVDYAFKRVFGVEKHLAALIHLLNAVLRKTHNHPVISVEIQNPFSSRDADDDKLSILDIKARDSSGRRFNVEMQLLPPAEMKERLLYYWAGVHIEQLAKGEEYALLKPTISICFLDRIIFPESPSYHLQFDLLNRESGLVFSQDIQMHTIELPKFRTPLAQLSDPLDLWCHFLRHAEEFDSTNLPRVFCEPPFLQAIEELKMLSQDELERERYKSRLRKQRDDSSFAGAWRSEGVLIGRIIAYQEALRREVMTEEELNQKSREELQAMSELLRNELAHSR